MSVKPFFRIFLSFVAASAVAAALTAGLVRWDQSRADTQQREQALQWARQVAAQAEGMALYARAQGMEDPSGWAVGFLSQAVEPRVMKISKFRRADASRDLEFYTIENGILDYGKVARPENGEGFRIQIGASSRGFLGARSKFGQDLTVALVFVSFWSALFASLLLITRSLKRERPDSLPSEELQAWVRETRVGLTQLGSALREVVRDGHLLVTQAAHARDRIIPVNQQLQQLLKELKSVRAEQLKDIEDTVARLCEASARSVAAFEQLPELSRKFSGDVGTFKSGMMEQVVQVQRLGETRKDAA